MYFVPEQSFIVTIQTAENPALKDMPTAFPEETGGWGLAGQRAAHLLDGNRPRLALFARNHLGILIASGIANLAGIAIPLGLWYALDHVLAGSGRLWLMAALVMAAILLEVGALWVRARLAAWVGAKYEHQLNCAAVEKLLATSLTDYESMGAGVHVDRLKALDSLRDFYTGQMILALADLPFVALYLVLIALIGHALVVVPLLLVGVFLIMARSFGQKLKTGLAAATDEEERRTNFLLEVLGGIHAVKALGLEPLLNRRYERLIEASARAEYKTNVISADAGNLAAAATPIMQLATLLAGVFLLSFGWIELGALAACSLLAVRCLQPLQRGLAMWSRLQSLSVTAERVDELFNLPSDRPMQLPLLSAGAGRVDLEHVTFRYRANLPAVLQDVSLTIQPGEAIGLTGDPGAGKTTLLWLVAGLIAPSSGRIAIDGQNPRACSVEGRSRTVSYLSPSAVLFEGTIIENIAMFRTGKTQDRAREAASIVGLDAMLDRLPQGFETRVGQGAIETLPRGLIQRVEIARALVEQPRILLFDSVNAALDSAGDELVKRLLERLRGRTTLIIASQRPSILRLADRVANIEKGQLSIRAGGV